MVKYWFILSSSILTNKFSFFFVIVPSCFWLLLQKAYCWGTNEIINRYTHFGPNMYSCFILMKPVITRVSLKLDLLLSFDSASFVMLIQSSTPIEALNRLILKDLAKSFLFVSSWVVKGVVCWLSSELPDDLLLV